MPPRPPHPVPTFGDDGQRPFLRGQDGGIYNGELGFGKSEILPDGLICRIPSGWENMAEPINVIASAAKQSILTKQKKDGLLRRKSSSQ